MLENRPAFWNIAHRGASGHAPENTATAFRLAVELGAAMIEFDVRETRDGVPVVLHDATFQRTGGLRRAVSKLTYRDVSQIDVGSWFGSRFAGERVPTLAEVCQTFGPRLRLNIELKGGARDRRGFAARVLEALRGSGCSSATIVSSFDHLLLRILRAESARLAIGYLADRGEAGRIVGRARDLGAAAVCIPLRLAVPGLIAPAHRAGLPVFVYTVDEPARMRALVARGVDGIFTNYPDRLARLLRERATPAARAPR